jgi:hypothetical protein
MRAGPGIRRRGGRGSRRDGSQRGDGVEQHAAMADGADAELLRSSAVSFASTSAPTSFSRNAAAYSPTSYGRNWVMAV